MAPTKGGLSRRGFIKLAGLASTTVSLPMINSGPANALLQPPVQRLRDGKSKAILFVAPNCTGCRQCVRACKSWNKLGDKEAIPKTFFSDPSTWIYMSPFKEGPIKAGEDAWSRWACMHCNQPACLEACPVGAIQKFEEGAVVIDQKTCIGCQYCVYECPFDVISFDYEKGKASKCTFCYDRLKKGLTPACVEACPYDALHFGDIESMKAKAREYVAKTPGSYIWGEEEAGGTHLINVLYKPFEEHGHPQVTKEPYGRQNSYLLSGLRSLARPAIVLGAVFSLGVGLANYVRRRKEMVQEEQGSTGATGEERPATPAEILVDIKEVLRTRGKEKTGGGMLAEASILHQLNGLEGKCGSCKVSP